MKKIAFVAVLIAVIVGIVFGGIALAGTATPDKDKPKPTPTPNPCVEMLNRINALSTQVGTLQSDVTALQAQMGNVTHMDTFSGNVTLSNTSAAPLDFVYPQARHVSITVSYWPMDAPGDEIQIVNSSPPLYSYAICTISSPPDPVFGGRTYEFDTDHWRLVVWDGGGIPLMVWYKVTVTYPQ